MQSQWSPQEVIHQWVCLQMGNPQIQCVIIIFRIKMEFAVFRTQPLCWFYLHVPILVGQIQMLVGSFPMKIDLHHFQTDPSHTLNPPMKIVRNCSILLGTQKKYRWWVLRRRDYDGFHVQLMIDGFVNVCENRFIRDVGSPAPRHASHLPFRATWPHARYEPCESRGWAP